MRSAGLVLRVWGIVCILFLLLLIRQIVSRMDLSHRLHALLPRKRKISQPRPHTSSSATPNRSGSVHARGAGDFGKNAVGDNIGERDRLLEHLLALPLFKQQEILRACLRSNITGTLPFHNDVQKCERTNGATQVPSQDAGRQSTNDGQGCSVVFSTAQPNPEEVPKIEATGSNVAPPQNLGITPVTEPGQLTFGDKLNNRIVLLDDGHTKRTALMLSEALCDQLLTTLESNRTTMEFLKQRDINKKAYVDRHDAIEKSKSRVRSQYENCQARTTLNAPNKYLEAMLVTKQKVEELNQGRDNVHNIDLSEAEQVPEIEHKQIERTDAVCCILEEAFIDAGLLSSYDPPDYEADIPPFDSAILKEIQLEDYLGNDDQEEHDELISDAHYKRPSSAASHTSLTDTTGRLKRQRNDTDTPSVYSLRDLDGTGERSHSNDALNKPSETAEEPIEVFHADRISNTAADNCIMSKEAMEAIADDSDFQDFLKNMDQKKIREADIAFADEQRKAEADNDSNLEKPWSQIQYGHQYISGIGSAEVKPLNEWAALLEDRETLRADVWKHWQEIIYCDEELSELQQELEDIEAKIDSPASPTGEDLPSNIHDQADEAAHVALRMQQIREHLALSEVRHDVAKFRAKWMGHEVDDQGFFKNSDSDYFLDEIKGATYTSQQDRIMRWVRDIISGFEDAVDVPELDEWDTSGEIEVWDQPIDAADRKNYPGYDWTYEIDVKEYFQNLKDCVSAYGA